MQLNKMPQLQWMQAHFTMSPLLFALYFRDIVLTSVAESFNSIVSSFLQLLIILPIGDFNCFR